MITPRKTKRDIRNDLIYSILNMDVDEVIDFETENFSSFRVHFAKSKKEGCPNRKFVFSEKDNKWKVWRKA
jgi:hypothetical protein